MPFFVLFNGKAGARDADRTREEIERVFSEASRRHEFFIVESPEQIDEVARHAAEAAVRHDGAVIVAGGDGTINAAVAATLPTGRPFGIVTKGTFNYSSRAHGIPLEPTEAATALLDAQVKPVQVGSVNDRLFLVNASLGLYPELLEEREEFQRQFGRKRAVAFWAGLTTLLHYRGQLTLEIEHDREREIVRTPTLFIGNNPLQLEQAGLPESEDVQHHRLAAVMVKPVSGSMLIWLALRGALAGLGEEHRVRNFAFSRMTVNPLQGLRRRTGQAIKVAIDGEICWMRAPLTFAVAPRSLQLLVPRAADRSH